MAGVSHIASPVTAEVLRPPNCTSVPPAPYISRIAENRTMALSAAMSMLHIDQYTTVVASACIGDFDSLFSRMQGCV